MNSCLLSWVLLSCIVLRTNAFDHHRPCRRRLTSCQCVTANDLRKSPSVQVQVKRFRDAKSNTDVDKSRIAPAKKIKTRKKPQQISDCNGPLPLWGLSTSKNPEPYLCPQQESSVDDDSWFLQEEYAAEDGQMSTLAFLSGKAKEWTHTEVVFYRHANGDYFPMIFNQEGIEPPLEHLEAASIEYMRRFSYQSTSDDFALQPEEIESRFHGSPFLLVANNVRDDWRVPNTFRNDKHNAVRYMLVPGETKGASTLFIKGVEGHEHSVFNSLMSRFVENWIQKHGSIVDYCRMNSGGRGYAPDNAFGPVVPDRSNPRHDADDRINGAPYARLVMEMEYAYRNGLEIREEGFIAMNNPYTRLFLAIMIWPTFESSNDFCAAAVLWGKDNEGSIVVRKAVDFGTRPLESNTKTWFNIASRNGDDSDILPPVVEWTRPRPSPGFDNLRSELKTVTASLDEDVVASNPDWIVTLPAKDLLYKASMIDSTEELPHILDNDDSLFTGCTVDLKFFASQISQGKL